MLRGIFKLSKSLHKQAIISKKASLGLGELGIVGENCFKIPPTLLKNEFETKIKLKTLFLKK